MYLPEENKFKIFESLQDKLKQLEELENDKLESLQEKSEELNNYKFLKSENPNYILKVGEEIRIKDIIFKVTEIYPRKIVIKPVRPAEKQ